MSIRPAKFVMSFVGPAHRLGEAWVRPHDVEIRHEPNGKTIEALRPRHLGFEVRVELTLRDGEVLGQLTREQVDDLELREGQTVFVRPKAARVSATPTAALRSRSRRSPRRSPGS